jgi:hypothetical protein
MTTPNGVSAVTTISDDIAISDLSQTIVRRADGAIVFKDLYGNTVVAHSNPELTKLFDAANNIVDPPVVGVEEGENTLTSGVSEVDFGTSDGDDVTKTFTITNSGNGILALDRTMPVVVTYDGVSFPHTQPSTRILKAGESTTFTITFHPIGADTRTASVVIKSNAVGGDFAFDLTAVANVA